MKQFMYFEDQPCGMGHHLTDHCYHLPLMGWMERGCLAEDRALLRWSERAKVGEYHEHRLGIVVRLKNAK